MFNLLASAYLGFSLCFFGNLWIIDKPFEVIMIGIPTIILFNISTIKDKRNVLY